MNIVVEGPDNSGKSTLVDLLAQRIGFPVQRGSRPGSPQEVNDRLQEYLSLKCRIFDRHPAISEPIYGEALRGVNVAYPHLVAELYRQAPLFVYCQNLRGLAGHVLKPQNADLTLHVSQLEQGHHIICGMYDEWAAKRAHLIYRIGDDMNRVADMITAAL